MNDCILYIIRHGEILSNKKDIYAGWSDEELTEQGRACANTLGKEAESWSVEAVFSSPIRRAVQTAEIINSHLGAEFFLEDGLKEIKMGSWEGLQIEEVQRRYTDDFNVWMTKPGDLNIVGRETLEEVQARAVAAIKSILNDGTHSVVLAVTHVAVIRCLQLYFNNEPLNSYKSIDVPNVSVFKISREASSGLYKMKRCASPF